MLLLTAARLPPAPPAPPQVSAARELRLVQNQHKLAEPALFVEGEGADGVGSADLAPVRALKLQCTALG